MASFKDEKTRLIAEGICPKGVGADLVKTGRRKIALVLAAGKLDDLKSRLVTGCMA